MLPVFLHHWRLFLPELLGKGKHLTIFAPPPEHFIKTLQKAEIPLDFKELCNNDKVALYPEKQLRAKKADQQNQPKLLKIFPSRVDGQGKTL